MGTIDRQREEARDWLFTGHDDRFEAWLQSHSVANRLADPWLLLVEGEWHHHARRHAEARFCLERAVAAFEAAEDHPGLFAACVDLMGVAGNQHDADALAVWAARATEWLPHGTLLDQAEYYHNLACAHLVQGRPAEAEALFRRVLDLPRFGSKIIGSIQQFAALNLGIMAMERSELEEAARRYRKALLLAEKQPLRPAIRYGAELYSARVAYVRGEFSAAEAALAALPAPPDPYRAAEAQQLHAELHLLRGRLEEAEQAIEAAIGAYDELNAQSADLGLALCTLGLVRTRQKRQDEALALHERGLALMHGWPQYQALGLLLRAEAEHAPRASLEAAHRLAKEAGAAFPAAWAGLRLGGAAADEARATIARSGCRGVLALVNEPAPPAPERLSLRLFGEFAVRVGDRPVERFPRRKARLLLAALALKPDGYSREDLADLLFPELDFAEAEHQLDNLTSTLRKALQPTLAPKEPSRYLEVRERRYRLHPGTYTHDLEAFGAALDAARGLSQGDREAWCEAQAAALEHYGGDLLAEPFFLGYFEAEREYWRQRHASATLDLAAALAELGHLEEAQAHWERLLALDPNCEDAHRQLIALYEAHERHSLAEAQRRRRQEALARLGLADTQVSL